MLLMSYFASFILCITWLIRYWWFYYFLNLHISIVDPLPLLYVCFCQWYFLPHNFLVSTVRCAALPHSVMSNSLWPLWAVVRQALLSLEFPRQEYWSGLHFLLQGIFLTQIKPTSLASLHCQVASLPLHYLGSLSSF